MKIRAQLQWLWRMFKDSRLSYLTCSMTLQSQKFKEVFFIDTLQIELCSDKLQVTACGCSLQVCYARFWHSSMIRTGEVA